MHGGGFFPYQAGRLRHARNVRPELQDAPEDTLASLRQLFFDIIVHDRQALRFLIARVGPANVVIGTDMPFDMGSYRPMDELQAVADDATVRKIAEENPAALYGWPTTAAANVPDSGAASKL
jgi:aminocarboxymuconate-semialdehyde decarboxylase